MSPRHATWVSKSKPDTYWRLLVAIVVVLVSVVLVVLVIHGTERAPKITAQSGSASLQYEDVAAASLPDGVATSGVTLSPLAIRPYGRSLDNLADLNDPRREYDENGVVVQPWPDHEGFVTHPVGLSWYIVYAIESYFTSGDPEYLNRAELNAQKLLDDSELVDGVRWFPYDFDHVFHGVIPLQAPWYSGMAQGMALSVFTRMYEATGEDKWKVAADETFASFTQDAPADRMFLNIDDGNLWFEEYIQPDYPASHVINGHMYAMWGLFDYAIQFDNERAAALFDAGATTVRDSFSEWRYENQWSFYCAGQVCKDIDLRPENYHRGVTYQLTDLALMTGDRTFLDMADTLEEDAAAASGS